MHVPKTLLFFIQFNKFTRGAITPLWCHYQQQNTQNLIKKSTTKQQYKEVSKTLFHRKQLNSQVATGVQVVFTRGKCGGSLLGVVVGERKLPEK